MYAEVINMTDTRYQLMMSVADGSLKRLPMFGCASVFIVGVPSFSCSVNYADAPPLRFQNALRPRWQAFMSHELNGLCVSNGSTEPPDIYISARGTTFDDVMSPAVFCQVLCHEYGHHVAAVIRGGAYSDDRVTNEMEAELAKTTLLPFASLWLSLALQLASTSP